MTSIPHSPGPAGASKAWWYLAIALATLSVIAGLWARFYALGAAPLAVDEFYLIRSVEQLLQHGLPRFECGGFYTRGILYQYAVAPLLAGGVSPEAAGRIVASLCNVMALPAVFLLTRRAGNRIAAALCIAVFALSLWEIEFSRFARMYAAYQALFLWYCVALMRATLDGDRPARLAVYLLSLAAPLVWEGGALLAVLNFVMPAVGKHGHRIRQTAVCMLIVVLVGFYSTINFRYLSAIAAWPPGYRPGVTQSSPVDMLMSHWPLLSLLTRPAWWLPFALLATGVAVAGWRRRRLIHGAPVVWATFAASAALMTLGLIGPGAGLLLAGLLAFADRGTTPLAPLRWAAPIFALAVIFWLVFAVVTAAAGTGVTAALRQALVLYIKYPNVIDSVLHPWLTTLPRLTLALGVLCASGVALALDRRHLAEMATLRLLLLIALALLLLIGVIPTTYAETRYTFFLYPLLLVIAAATAVLITRRAAAWLPRTPVAAGIAALTLLAFGISGDFNPGHLLRIDQPQSVYRQALPGPLRAHLYIRQDYPAVGHFLASHAGPRDAIVVAEVAATRYIDTSDAVYLSRSGTLFANSSCRKGTVERWTSLPLLSTVDEFDNFVTGAQSVWLVIPHQHTRAKIGALADLLTAPAVFSSPDGSIDVYQLQLTEPGRVPAIVGADRPAPRRTTT